MGTNFCEYGNDEYEHFNKIDNVYNNDQATLTNSLMTTKISLYH